MTVRLAGIRLVLLDIEGTTTPITFVHEILFPYARAGLHAWLQDARGSEDLTDVARMFATEYAADVHRGEAVPPWPHAASLRSSGPAGHTEPLTAYVLWLMDRDRKSPALKRLQGLIWERGYRAGELRGEVYPDVPDALRRWRQAGIDIAIYSSGSELAQRRLFESIAEGDVTTLIAGFFDTAVGQKREAASYRRIASLAGHAPEDILFVSDVTAELAAAREAGCRVALSIRPGNPAQTDAGMFPSVESLAEIS